MGVFFTFRMSSILMALGVLLLLLQNAFILPPNLDTSESLEEDKPLFYDRRDTFVSALAGLS